MKPTRTVHVFDAADIDAESAFWAALLDGEVDKGDGWHSIKVDGQWCYAVQLAPDHVPPQWPDGSPQQAHIDLYVDMDAVEDAHAEILAKGARLLQDADSSQPHGFRVYADPAGHPFCLCWD